MVLELQNPWEPV